MKHALALLLIIPFLSLAAPVPVHRPKPLPQITPGVYHQKWAGQESDLHFHRDGHFENRWYGELYTGRWEWDARARTLHVKEQKDDLVWWWKVSLNDKLHGVASVDHRDYRDWDRPTMKYPVEVALTRKP